MLEIIISMSLSLSLLTLMLTTFEQLHLHSKQIQQQVNRQNDLLLIFALLRKDLDQNKCKLINPISIGQNKNALAMNCVSKKIIYWLDSKHHNLHKRELDINSHLPTGILSHISMLQFGYGITKNNETIFYPQSMIKNWTKVCWLQVTVNFLYENPKSNFKPTKFVLEVPACKTKALS